MTYKTKPKLPPPFPNRVVLGQKPMAVKVSISLPRHLLEFADQVAAQSGTDRSKVIQQALEEKRLEMEGVYA